MSNKIHPTALIDPAADLGDSISVGPYCIIGANVVLKDHVKLISHVHIGGYTSIGEHSVIYPYASLGTSPQIINYEQKQSRLTIGRNNIIREYVTINAGSTRSDNQTTLIGDYNYFMIHVHIAHDCIVGNHTIFANDVMIGGHTHVEDYVFLGGRCAAHQNSWIGRQSFISAESGIISDIIPYSIVFGRPAYLEGLNIIGMRRKNISKDTVRTVRNAYEILFNGEGVFEERLDRVQRDFAGITEVKHILDFISSKERTRQLCFPRKSGFKKEFEV